MTGLDSVRSQATVWFTAKHANFLKFIALKEYSAKA